MTLVYRAIAAVLLLVGVALAAYLLVYPIYQGQGSAAGADDVWDVLNVFIAVVTIVMLAIAWVEKHTLVDGEGTWGRLVVHVRFYFAIALLLAFFNNWCAQLWGVDPPSGLIWVLIDIGVPILATEMGINLWRESNLLARIGLFIPADDDDSSGADDAEDEGDA